MDEFDGFDDALAIGARIEFRGRGKERGSKDRTSPGRHGVGCAHLAKVGDQRPERAIAQPNAVDIDHRVGKAGLAQQPGESGGLDPGMDPRSRAASATPVGSEHCCAKHGQRLAARENPCDQSARGYNSPKRRNHSAKIFRGVELAKQQDHVGLRVGEPGERIQVVGKGDTGRSLAEWCCEGGVGKADQHCAFEASAKRSKTIGEVLDRAFMEEAAKAGRERSAAASGEELGIEQGQRHGGACAARLAGGQGGVGIAISLGRVGRVALDFALPPRCAGCGAITPENGMFCSDCWLELDFLGSVADGCERCGETLGTAGQCAWCPEGKHPVDRLRAAVAYGEIARGLVLRLKYSRKTGLARTIAFYMRRPLAELTPGALLVPVPLHRWRLWSRGFNQSVLIGAALAKHSAHVMDRDLLVRHRATPRLKAMSGRDRRAAVEGAFALRPDADVKGRDIILVDDVITTASTADACAKVLKRAGARRVELVAWARVVRHDDLG